MQLKVALKLGIFANNYETIRKQKWIIILLCLICAVFRKQKVCWRWRRKNWLVYDKKTSTWKIAWQNWRKHMSKWRHLKLLHYYTEVTYDSTYFIAALLRYIAGFAAKPPCFCTFFMFVEFFYVGSAWLIIVFMLPGMSVGRDFQ